MVHLLFQVGVLTVQVGLEPQTDWQCMSMLLQLVLEQAHASFNDLTQECIRTGG